MNPRIHGRWSASERGDRNFELQAAALGGLTSGKAG
jgi:hypothetical protein